MFVIVNLKFVVGNKGEMFNVLKGCRTVFVFVFQRV